MGYALAEAAAERGWAVELVSGPVCLAPPGGVRLIPVVTGEEMLLAVEERFGSCDLLVMAAAVADYRPKVRAEQKIKKSGGGMTLDMAPVADILQTVAAKKKQQLVAGFAAETGDLQQRALEKMRKKHCDYIAANIIGREGTGFGADGNEVWLFKADGGMTKVGPAPKKEVAEQLISRWAEDLSAF